MRLWLHQKSVDLSRQEELDTIPKAIQQIEFVGQTKKLDADHDDDNESIFILTILVEKLKKRDQTFLKEV